MPLAREVVKDLAIEHGACIRPVPLRRTSLDTGAVEQVLVPCGHTLASEFPIGSGPYAKSQDRLAAFPGSARRD